MPPTTSVLRWGMLGAGDIGKVVVPAANSSPGAEFVAVAARDGVRAKEWAAAHDVPRSFGSYDELLDCAEVDAVYVALPTALHTPWTLRALEAGKHVVCEKPFAMTAADAAACFDTAERVGRVCVEGLMYRLHPQTVLARRLVAEGAIGRLTSVRATLTIDAPPGDIRRDPAVGGGAVFDVGCYCLSAIRYFAGEPTRVYASQVGDGPGGVPDLRMAGVLDLPDGVLGHFDIGLDMVRRDELELHGTAGRIVLPNPWLTTEGYVDLYREGRVERVPADPGGGLGLLGTSADAYRIQFGLVADIAAGAPREFGRADAVAQAGLLEAALRSAATGLPTTLG